MHVESLIEVTPCLDSDWEISIIKVLPLSVMQTHVTPKSQWLHRVSTLVSPAPRYQYFRDCFSGADFKLPSADRRSLAYVHCLSDTFFIKTKVHGPYISMRLLSTNLTLKLCCCLGIVWEPTKETSSHATCQGTFRHSHLSLLSHCGLILT